MQKDAVGLALSGGGIRSATFALGLLQAWAHTDLLRYIDCLSTVSGGGYIGAFLGRLFTRSQHDLALAAGLSPATRLGRPRLVQRILQSTFSRPMVWLRENGRYLAQRIGRRFPGIRDRVTQLAGGAGRCGGLSPVEFPAAECCPLRGRFPRSSFLRFLRTGLAVVESVLRGAGVARDRICNPVRSGLLADSRAKPIHRLHGLVDSGAADCADLCSGRAGGGFSIRLVGVRAPVRLCRSGRGRRGVPGIRLRRHGLGGDLVRPRYAWTGNEPFAPR